MKKVNRGKWLLGGGFAVCLALPTVLVSLLGAQAVSAEPNSNDTSQASSNLPASSVSVANNATLQPRSFVLEHRLQDKTLCRVMLQGQAAGTNLLDTVDSVEISLAGCKIALPPGACSGWKDFDPASGLQVIETGRTQEVILMGGKPDSRWHAKLTIQNGALIAWQYTPENRLPVLVRHPTLIPGPTIKVIPAPASNHADMLQNAPLNTQGK